MSGILYLVATPIGHLGDITLRAVETLREVDFVACEDTRHSGQLLTHLGISKPLVRCDDHTEKKIAAKISERVRNPIPAPGPIDAGTPGVSDPGYAVVQAAIEQGLPIIPIPGPSAVTAALCASGLSTHAFRFAGFLPERQGPRLKRLALWADDDATQILFVPPHKLRRWVTDLIDAWGDRPACLAREMTKKFEEFQRGRLSEIAATYVEKTPRGEMVLLVAGKTE